MYWVSLSLFGASFPVLALFLCPHNVNTFPSASRSSAPQLHTPPPYGIGSSVASLGKSSLGIKRGTRRTLFSTSPSSKEKLAEDSAAAAEEVLDSAAESEEVLDASSVAAASEALQTDVVSSVAAVSETMGTTVVPSVILVSETLKADVVSSVPAPEEKAELPITLKNKRVASAGKGGSALKKTK